MPKAALLIVDVQQGFIREATAHIPGLVETLQDDYPLVIATRFINPPGSSFRRLIHWDRFAPGSADTELAFTPRVGAIIIDKPRYTCVTSDFLALLDEHSIDEVHLCGIATNNCVLKCAVDLFEADRTPIVLAGHCASHAGAEFHNAALRIIERFIGRDQVRYD